MFTESVNNMKKFRRDECENMYGKKVRVKYVGSKIEHRKIKDNFYIQYDEDEVYHIENTKTKKIIKTFNCKSLIKAIEFAKKELIYLENIEQIKENEKYGKV